MKVWLMKRLVVLSACVILGCTIARAQGRQNMEAPLTNASVVKLVRAGFSEKTVITIIQTRPTSFDLAPDRLIELKKSGVSEKIILAMLAHDETRVIASDSWSDDPFFNDGIGGRRSESSDKIDDGSINIFGSSGGVKGRSRSRGANGSTDGDTQTTGSATVRIIRQPTEAGGAPPKLERTPTLKNESIIELVEAGFSEGTVIRRIEESPADFDLSPAKLTELRRRRVSEPVIAAMRAAMSETDAPAKSEK